MDKAEEIAERARKSISSYCSEECRAYCCRKGYLVLSGNEACLIAGSDKEYLERKGTLKKLKSGRYSLFLGEKDSPCPMLNGFRCMIHNNPKRPAACRNFPVFLDRKAMAVRLSHRCLAVKERKLYSFEKEWHAIGWKVVQSDPFYDIELFNVRLSETDAAQ